MFASPDALVAFVLSAELGSFSAAARQLGKRQSTISEAIANLEIDLGVMLFDRQARLPTLSEAGANLLPLARRILAAQLLPEVAGRSQRRDRQAGRNRRAQCARNHGGSRGCDRRRNGEDRRARAVSFEAARCRRVLVRC